MAAKTFKRMSINLTDDLDNYVLELRMRKEYVRCSYVEIIRILMEEGAKSMGLHQQNNNEKP